MTASRVSDKPLLIPGGTWGSQGRFNPSAIRVGKKTVLLFREIDSTGVSRIGYAESLDGLSFQVRPEPVLSPETDYEKGGGVEDPRVVRIGRTYYLTYTAYNGHDAQLCLAISRDLLRWERRGVIMPAYKGTWNIQWTKSGSILPEKVNGKWWMYYMGNRRDTDGESRDYMGVASSPDLLHWSDATSRPVLDRRPGSFDSRVMEPGPAPFRTKAGILLLYNGADDRLVYGPGWVLFDLLDPTKVLARSDGFFLHPELEWERIGQVPNVIFLEGLVRHRRSRKKFETLFTGFYGAADRYVGAAQLAVTTAR